MGLLAASGPGQQVRGLRGLGPRLAPGFKGSREASGLESRHFYSALKAFQGGSAIPRGLL